MYWNNDEFIINLIDERNETADIPCQMFDFNSSVNEFRLSSVAVLWHSVIQIVFLFFISPNKYINLTGGGEGKHFPVHFVFLLRVYRRVEFEFIFNI